MVKVTVLGLSTNRGRDISKFVSDYFLLYLHGNLLSPGER